jgi:hypothetical protein
MPRRPGERAIFFGEAAVSFHDMVANAGELELAGRSGTWAKRPHPNRIRHVRECAFVKAALEL